MHVKGPAMSRDQMCFFFIFGPELALPKSLGDWHIIFHFTHTETSVSVGPASTLVCYTLEYPRIVNSRSGVQHIALYGSIYHCEFTLPAHLQRCFRLVLSCISGFSTPSGPYQFIIPDHIRHKRLHPPARKRLLRYKSNSCSQNVFPK